MLWNCWDQKLSPPFGNFLKIHPFCRAEGSLTYLKNVDAEDRIPHDANLHTGPKLTERPIFWAKNSAANFLGQEKSRARLWTPREEKPGFGSSEVKLVAQTTLFWLPFLERKKYCSKIWIRSKYKEARLYLNVRYNSRVNNVLRWYSRSFSS